MKAVLKETKRIMAVLLSIAMIFAYVPNNIYGAQTTSGNDVDEVEAAQTDDVVEEESETKAAAGAADSQEPEEAEEVKDDELDAKADITIKFDGTTVPATFNAGLYEYNQMGLGATLNATSTAQANYGTAYADAEKDYVFVAIPNSGEAFNLKDEDDKDKPLLTGAYVDYSTNTDGEAKAVESTTFKIEDPTEAEAAILNRGAKKITIPKATIASVLAGKKSDKAASGILTLTFVENADDAQWKISGFDLNGIKEKAKYKPSLKTMTNGTNKVLDLTKVLEVGSIDKTSLKVSVQACKSDGTVVWDSGVIADNALTTDIGTDTSAWKAATPAQSGQSKIWAAYKVETTGEANLSIHGAAISYFYNEGYDVFITVDASTSTVGVVSIKTTAASEEAATFGTATAGTNEVTGTPNSTTGAAFDTTDVTDGNKDFVFEVAKKDNYSHIGSVTWTVNGKSDDSYKVDAPATGATPTKVTIPNAQLKKGNIVVTVVGAYTVSKQGNSSEYAIYDTDGKALTKALAGQDLIFQALPGDGKNISGVEYTIGTEEGVAEKDTTNGYYKIPKDKITGDIVLNPTIGSSSSEGSHYLVKTAGNYSTDVVIQRLDKTNTTITNVGVNVTKNDEFLFTVTPNSTHVVEEVKYSMGTTKDAPLTPVYGKTYKIPSITANTTITVVYQAAVSVHAPTNKNVTVNFAEAGKSKKEATGSFSFTATPANDNVKITGIWYNTSGNHESSTGGTKLATKDGGTFNLTAETWIYVETEEVVDSSKFKAIFSDGGTPTTTRIRTTYKAGAPKKEINIESQELALVMGDTTKTITANFKPINDGKIRPALTGGTSSITAPEETEILVLNAAGQTITPNKIGNQDVTISYKKGDNENTGNVLVYPGILKVTVTQPYTDLQVISDKDTAYTYVRGAVDATSLDKVGLTLYGKDGQTGEFVPVNVSSSQVNGIAWSFVPSTDQDLPEDYTHAFTPSTTTVNAAVNGVSTKSGNTGIYAVANKNETVTIKAIVTYKDNSKAEATKTVNFVEPLSDSYFLARTITGSVKDFDVFKTDSDPAIYNANGSDAIVLALNVNDRKTATIKYDVYKIVDASLTATDYDTEDEIAELLKEEKISKVTDAVIGTPEIRNVDATEAKDREDTNEYVKLDTTSDGYKITANRITTDTVNHVLFVAPEIKINNIKVPNLNFANTGRSNRNVAFVVTGELPRNKVDLITVDDQTTDKVGNPLNTVMSLKDTYLAYGDYSKINKVYGTGTAAKQIGVEFNSVGTGVSFRLPSEDDFATKPNAKKALFGWAKTSFDPANPEGTVNESSTNTGKADVIEKPGSYVTVGTDVGYKAIWVDKYIPYTRATLAGDATLDAPVMKLLDATTNYVDADKKNQYPTEVPATIAIGSNIPTILALGKVKWTDDVDNTYVIATKAVDLSHLTVEEETYPGGFTLKAKSEDAQYDLDSTSLGSRIIKTADDAEASSDVVLTAGWTDSKSSDTYSEDLTYALATVNTSSVTVADSSSALGDTYTMIESGVPATLTATLTDAHASISGAANSKTIALVAADGTETADDSSATTYNRRFYRYDYEWTSKDPTVATIVKGKDEDQDEAVLTPLKGGKTTVTLSVKKNGKEIAKKSFELTVNAMDVKFAFADAQGNAIDDTVLARAANTNTDVLKVKVTTKSGAAISGGSFGFGNAGSYNDNKVIDNSQPSVTVSGAGDAKGFTNVTIKTKDFVGTDVLHIVYTNSISGESLTFQKDIKVKTYYAVIFKTPDTNTFITKNGTRLVAADGKTPINGEIQLTEDDMKDVVKTAYSELSDLNQKNFIFKNVSLEGYSAEYSDAVSTKKEFSHWELDVKDNTSNPSGLMDPTKLNPAPTYAGRDTYKEGETITKLVGYKNKDATNYQVAENKSESDFVYGSGYYVVKPVMANVITVSGVPGEITMNYSSTSTTANKKTVTMTVDPATYASPLRVKGEKRGFYSATAEATDANDLDNRLTTIPDSEGKAKFFIRAYNFYDTSAGALNAYDSSDKETWKAGSDTLGIYGPNASKPLATINLYVNGLNFDTSTRKVQYFENGNLVKSDYKTVDGNTYYFDADGFWIESTGITKINGKSVLIVNGVVAPKGKNVYNGNTYFIGESGVIQTGWLTADGAAATASTGVYYADPAKDGRLVTGLQTLEGKTYYFQTDAKKAVSSVAGEYELKDSLYYVGPDGDVAIAKLFTATIAGVKGQYLANEKGELVTYAMTEAGKITVAGVGYIVNKDNNTAEMDDVLYDPQVTIAWPEKYNKGTTFTATYTGTVKSKNNSGAQQNISGTVTVTPATVAADDKSENIEFTGTVDLSKYFKTQDTAAGKADNKVETRKYFFKDGGIEGISKTYIFKSVKKWNWPSELPVGVSKPTVTADITYTVKEEGKADTTETINTTASVSDGVDKGSKLEFTATVTTLDGQTKTDKNEYNKKTGKEQGDDTETESEPEPSVTADTSYNMFYIGQAIEVPGLPVSDGGSLGAKADNYWKVENGNVVLKSDTTGKDAVSAVKKAVSASNSLIDVTTSDGEQFTYQLPVYYMKPSVKLTSTKGTMKVGTTGVPEEQSVKTSVQMKKSNGLFENIDVEGAITITPPTTGINYSGSVEGYAFAVSGSEITFTNSKVGDSKSAKSSMKINVQPETWREAAALSYAVVESKKNVLTGSAKQLVYNMTAKDDSGLIAQGQEFTLDINGGSDYDAAKDPVTVTLPRNWANSGIEGIEDGSQTSLSYELKFKDGATPTKGNYSIKFATADKASCTLKIAISNLATTDKAITLNYKTKANIAVGQKGVVVPTLKGVGGTIESVAVSDEKLTAAYNATTNQIIVTPGDGVTGAVKEDLKFTMTTSTGVECNTTIKNFQVLAKNPSVKIPALKLKKTAIKSEDGASGYTNLLCTVKSGGKTFAVKPTKIEFYEGNNKLTPNDTGVYTLKNGATFELEYSEDEGLLTVKNFKQASGSAGTIKVWTYFNGNETKPVKASFAIKAVN